VLTRKRRREARVTPRVALVALAFTFSLCVLAVGILQGDVPDLIGDGTYWGLGQLTGRGYLTSYPLLFIEEAGVPLPAPGDVFVLYVGAHVPHSALPLAAAWLGFVLVVLAGASTLYWISRRVGRDIAHSRVGRFIHLTPERLDRAEGWFARYGPVAIIFGRHVPGLRIPITVACGVLQVSYRLFAACVAISAAIWAGFWVAIGAVFGLQAEAFLASHRWAYWVGAGVIAVVVGVYLARRALAAR
jgi:membrane protein DedA with SNARE-associated domain